MRLGLISDGNFDGLRVVDMETGREVENVSHVNLERDAFQGVYDLRIRISIVDTPPPAAPAEPAPIAEDLAPRARRCLS